MQPKFREGKGNLVDVAFVKFELYGMRHYHFGIDYSLG